MLTVLRELRQRIDAHCEHFNKEPDHMRKRPDQKGRVQKQSPRTEHPAQRGAPGVGVMGLLLQVACHWRHQKDDQKSFSGDPES